MVRGGGGTEGRGIGEEKGLLELVLVLVEVLVEVLVVVLLLLLLPRHLAGV